MVYGEFGNDMSEVIRTLHSIDRSLSIIVKEIEKKNKKGSSTNDIMKKYFGKFFKPKNKEYTPYGESIADKVGESGYKLIASQDIDYIKNETRIVVNNIDDEANKLKY